MANNKDDLFNTWMSYIEEYADNIDKKDFCEYLKCGNPVHKLLLHVSYWGGILQVELSCF